jgi:hypothetical protein
MWTSAMAAPGANRIIVSPFINNFVIPNGEVTYDGGNTNETLNGMAFYTGVTPVTVTGFLVNASPEVVKAFRKLAVSSYGVGFSDLEAFMFNERGDIICRNRGTATSPIYRGIPVYQMGIGTVGTAGLGANNQNNISFQLLGNWDEDLITVSTYNAAMPWSPLELENTCA